MNKATSWGRLLGFIVISELAGILGSFFTVPSIPTWYARLLKPSFNPPGWLFGPVWTLLYALQGLAAYLVWEKRSEHPLAPTALKLFWTQLVLNALWTPLFFGAKNPSLAFLEIVLLWVALALTVIWFFRVRKIAGFLLLPYLAWVSFAAVLNFTIWRLNP